MHRFFLAVEVQVTNYFLGDVHARVAPGDPDGRGGHSPHGVGQRVLLGGLSHIRAGQNQIEAFLARRLSMM